MNSEESTMKCPTCKHTNLVISERQGVEIDYCPECRGIWLDRGELDKIIERNEYTAPRLASSGSKHYSNHHHGHYKPKRRKSFLNELFDL